MVGRWRQFLHTDGGTLEASGRRRAWLPSLFFGWLTLLALWPVAGQGQSYLAWREPAALARLVFVRPPQDEFCLVVAPVRTATAGVLLDGMAWAKDKRVPLGVIWSDATNLVFLADCRGVAARKEVALYLFDVAQLPVTNVPVADPGPVRFYAQRTAGQDFPVSWEQVQMLETRVDREPCLQGLPRFEAKEGAPSGWYRGDWQRKNHLFQLSSWVLFPVSGRYVFGMQSESPVWLQVDGVTVVGQVPTRQAGWTKAAPLLITAGLHQVVARGVTQQRLNFLADWQQEGYTNAPGVVAITGGLKVPARWEQRGDQLHVMAEITTEPTYTFVGVTNLFVPIWLESRSVSPDRRDLRHSWWLAPDGMATNAAAGTMELGQGARCPAVLSTAVGAWRIRLRVTDDIGHTAQDQICVPRASGPAHNQYMVAGRLVGVPPCGYEEDMVRPEIHVRATSPDTVKFQVEADILYANGKSTNVSAVVDIRQSWGRLLLPAASADAFQQITWRIRHAGVTLDQGAQIFERTPFRNLPTALDGELLLVSSNALMLVAQRASAGETAPFEGLRAGQRLLLLDGFLVPPDDQDMRLGKRLEALLTAADAGPMAAYRRVSFQALEGAAGTPGVARLQPLVQVSTLLPAEVVIVAPSFEALGQGESLAQYERRLAALVGLLAGPGRASVILLTPPPFAVLPGCEGLAAVGVAAPSARQLAEIICRVADAYGQPVADLYTVFMTAERRTPLLAEGVLTPEGLTLAGDVLRRVLAGPRKGSP